MIIKSVVSKKKMIKFRNNFTEMFQRKKIFLHYFYILNFSDISKSYFIAKFSRERIIIIY